jgi:tetratricopeptide (TPR) repeat protein
MKKIIIAFMALAFSAAISAQMDNEKFVKAMEKTIALADSARTSQDWIDVTAAFERIAEAEKTQWLPYYYAARGHVMSGIMSLDMNNLFGNNTDKTDPRAEAAQKALDKAISLSKETSETWVIKKMISSLRMLGDVMNRYQTDMPAATAALETAKKMDPNNPRVYLLEGEDKFNTPAEYGGSKEEAKKLFDKAKELMGKANPESSIHPRWGMGQLMYYLSQL